MHSNPVESTTVAVLPVLVMVVAKGGFPVPSKFNTRSLLTVTLLLAMLLGLIAFAARS